MCGEQSHYDELNDKGAIIRVPKTEGHEQTLGFENYCRIASVTIIENYR